MIERSCPMNIHKTRLLLIFMLVGALMLAACGKEEESSDKQEDTKVTTNNEQENSNASSSENIGESTPPPIQEAENIPAKEKKALLAAFDQHVKTFNQKDLDGYMSTISKNPTSFKLDEERDYIKNIFETTDIQINPQNVIIIDYKDNEANIFTEMKTIVSETGSKKKVEQLSRQINTFKKEDGQWKLNATFAMETK